MTNSPNLILAGFQKCGSTYLARTLGAHPAIDLAEGKEPNTFLKSNETSYPEIFANLYRDPLARYRLDASINYLVSEGAMLRASAWCPSNAKIIAIVRDPVERTLSAFLHLKKRFAERRGFAEILDTLPLSTEEIRSAEITSTLRAMQSGDLDLFRQIDPHDERWINALYVSNSLYAVHLERLARLFPASQIKVIFFEEMVSHPEDVFSDLAEFLDLDDLSASIAPKHPSNRTVVPKEIPPLARTPSHAHMLYSMRHKLGVSRVQRVTADVFPKLIQRQVFDLVSDSSQRLYEQHGKSFQGSDWDRV